MIQEIKRITSSKKDLRNFGITMGMIMFIITAVLFWKEYNVYKLFFNIAISFILTGIALPVILKPVYWPWMVFAAILGWFMTRVILSILFYGIMTPIALVSRCIGKQFLILKHKKPSPKSYWIVRKVEAMSKEKYEKQF